MSVSTTVAAYPEPRKVLEVPEPRPPEPLDAATARTTGLLYLGLAICGLFGFLVIRSRLFVPADPAATLDNLVALAALARVGIAIELGLVVTQVLAALWFFKLFRPVDDFAAGAIALFGSINAVAILGNAALLATALEVAQHPVVDGASQLLYVLSGNVWGVSNVFFGLWLIPMGSAALRSHQLPRALGYILIGGGAGYVVNAFARYLLPAVPTWLDTALVMPATVGEFWMIGWLVWYGLRRK